MLQIQQRHGPAVRVMDADGWRDEGLRLGRSRDQWQSSGSRLMWDIGDWIVVGEDVVFAHLKKRRIRQMAAQLTGYSGHTLTLAVSVARRVEPGVRIDGLTWWHHQVVAGLGPATQTEWLTRAAEEEWSVRELRSRLHERGVVGRSRPSRSMQRRLVLELTKLRRDDIEAGLLARLHAWWEGGERASLGIDRGHRERDIAASHRLRWS